MLTDENEVLLRQIHPTFIQGGQPSSQPFAPTPKDANRLSVDRSSLTTAADSHALFTGNGHASEAVYGVSVGEFGRRPHGGKSDADHAAFDKWLIL